MCFSTQIQIPQTVRAAARNGDVFVDGQPLKLTLELTQRLGQHFLAGAHAFLQAGESQLFFPFQRVDNQQGPFVGDALQDFAHQCFFFGQEVR